MRTATATVAGLATALGLLSSCAEQPEFCDSASEILGDSWQNVEDPRALQRAAAAAPDAIAADFTTLARIMDTGIANVSTLQADAAVRAQEAIAAWRHHHCS